MPLGHGKNTWCCARGGSCAHGHQVEAAPSDDVARGRSVTDERSVGSQDHGEAWICVSDTRGGKALGLCAGKGMIRRWEGAAREVWREV